MRKILTSFVEAVKKVNRKTKPFVMVKVTFSKIYWYYEIEVNTGDPR